MEIDTIEIDIIEIAIIEIDTIEIDTIEIDTIEIAIIEIDTIEIAIIERHHSNVPLSVPPLLSDKWTHSLPLSLLLSAGQNMKKC